MGKLFILVLIFAQALAMFACGMLFAYHQSQPALIALAIGGTLTLVECISVTGIRVEVGEKEKP